MNGMATDRRMVWLLMGMLAGLGLAQFWPAEHVQAMATDRADRFAVTTVNVGPGLPDAIFVLDFLTGRLTGALINSQTGKFTNFYFRNIAADFLATPNAKLKYAMIPGTGIFSSNAGATSATGILYIGELSSGKMVAYSFKYRNSTEPMPPIPVEPLDFYPFRDPDAK